MQWRRKLRKEQNTPKSTKEIIETLRHAGQLIANAPQIPDDNAREIRRQIEELTPVLDQYMERQRERQIRELEARQQELNAQLAALRGGE